MKLIPIKANMTELTLDNGDAVLFSYETPVAAITAEGAFKTSKKWSRTTSKHINAWGPDYKGGEKPQEFFDSLVKGV